MGLPASIAGGLSSADSVAIWTSIATTTSALPANSIKTGHHPSATHHSVLADASHEHLAHPAPREGGRLSPDRSSTPSLVTGPTHRLERIRQPPRYRLLSSYISFGCDVGRQDLIDGLVVRRDLGSLRFLARPCEATFAVTSMIHRRLDIAVPRVTGSRTQRAIVSSVPICQRSRWRTIPSRLLTDLLTYG